MRKAVRTAPYGFAPRVYCAANPLRYTDPTGMKLSDGEHQVYYDIETNTFTVDEGFKPEALQILNVLAETKYGKYLIEDAVNLEYDVQIMVEEGDEQRIGKTFILGSADLFYYTGTTIISRSILKIFKGGIERQMNYLNENKDNIEEIKEPKYQRWAELQPTVEQLTAGVLAHEFGHTTIEGYGNENISTENEMQICNEYLQERINNP